MMKNIEGHTPPPWFIDRAPNGYMLRGPLPDDAPDESSAWRKAIAILVSPEDHDLLRAAPELAAENDLLRARNGEMRKALEAVRDDVLEALDGNGNFRPGKTPQAARRADALVRGLLAGEAEEPEGGEAAGPAARRVPTGDKVLAEQLLGELKRLRAFIGRNATPWNPDNYLVNGEDAHLEKTDLLILAGENAGDDRLHKHYMLRAVPRDSQALARSCGFVPLADETGEHQLWHLVHPQGPLSDVPRGEIEGWLLRERIAWQIFVADLWGGEVG